MTDVPFTVFIGYDERQPEAFKACKQSILETASKPVHVVKLHHQMLRDMEIFNRPWTVEADGSFKDMVDGKPFSTQFSHTRFLVPHLARTMGTSPLCVFVDSDFIFKTDVHELIKYTKVVEKCPVYVVKHNYTPKSTIKMDNRDQHKYNRKLWTSLMLFDLRHELNYGLNPAYVNSASGMDMHQFKWLGVDRDEVIGELPESWNFIPGHTKTITIDAIHYTEGTPHMKGYENCQHAELYIDAYKRALKEELNENG